MTYETSDIEDRIDSPVDANILDDNRTELHRLALGSYKEKFRFGTRTSYSLLMNNHLIRICKSRLLTQKSANKLICAR